MKRNRKKEYELLGKFMVNFENLTDEIRHHIQMQMVYLKIDLTDPKIQSSVDILLANTSVDRLNEKFRSMHIIIFSNNHPSTDMITLFCKCMKDLIELRNLIIHATWHIGYVENTGTEMYFSRGFNDRCSKQGLTRKVIYFQATTFKKMIRSIEDLTKFMRDYDLLTDEQNIKISESIKKDRLNEICAFFKEYHKKMKEFNF